MVSSKTLRVGEFSLQGRQGSVRHPPVDRGLRDAVAECLGQPALGIGLQPGGDTVAMDPEQGGNRPAVTRLSTRCQIQCMQPLAFLEVFLTWHAVV
jgi:hypothetical protein